MADKSKNTNSEIVPKPAIDFPTTIDTYVAHLEAQAEVIPLTLEMLNAKIIHEVSSIEVFINTNRVLSKDNETGQSSYKLPEDHIKSLAKLTDKIATSGIALKLIPINFSVSYVSQYDAFLGNLIRVIFIEKPEILNSSEKNILFSELLQFSTLDEARILS